jgi:peptidoglycan hydrolase-like protein with peptidoglycan-binding domain
MDIRRSDLVIYEVQTYLRELYKAGYALPMITPDGIYGELTAEAVGDFQRLMGITESGAVDFVTWNSLVSEARKVREIYALPEKISPFDMLMYSAIIDTDDEYDIVYIVQVMLRALHVYDYQNVVVNGKMDDATRDALADFSARNGIENPDGQITKEVWNALARAYSQYILKSPGQ